MIEMQLVLRRGQIVPKGWIYGYLKHLFIYQASGYASGTTTLHRMEFDVQDSQTPK